MTISKAIQELKTGTCYECAYGTSAAYECSGENPTCPFKKAIHIAVDLLSKYKWTKYDDDDPKTWPEDGYWYIWQHKSGALNILRWKQDAQNHFYPDPYMWDIEDVVAYMPLPERYKEAEK